MTNQSYIQSLQSASAHSARLVVYVRGCVGLWVWVFVLHVLGVLASWGLCKDLQRPCKDPPKTLQRPCKKRAVERQGSLQGLCKVFAVSLQCLCRVCALTLSSLRSAMCCRRIPQWKKERSSNRNIKQVITHAARLEGPAHFTKNQAWQINHTYIQLNKKSHRQTP